jgi:hypothetical protein
VLVGLSVASCTKQDAHPDVLLITVDTLRAEHLSAYGFELESSPEIDALAANSVLFDRAIAAASMTAPSHASVMTSRYVREHSVGHLNGKSQLKGLETLADRRATRRARSSETSCSRGSRGSVAASTPSTTSWPRPSSIARTSSSVSRSVSPSQRRDARSIG